MRKRKIALMVLAATISTNLLTTINANAEVTTVVSEASRESTEETNTNSITSSNFDLINDKNYSEYEKSFKVNNIKSYSNNSGKYSTSTLDKAFDGDKATHWETGKPNSETHTNEVIVTFEEVEEINRIVYAARQNASNKGYATKFSVYSSLTEDGDDFELVGSGQSARTSSYSEFKFQNTEFKRLKFVFDEAYNLWASSSEFMFFKEDNLSDIIDDIFTDGTMTKLAEEYNSAEAIEKLNELVKSHPLKTNYEKNIEIANELLKNPDCFSDAVILTASQRGVSSTESAKRLIQGSMLSLDPFGYYVTPGETFTVYVDADVDSKMPRLCLGQGGINKGDWRTWINLKPGKNVITAPTTINPSAIYIVNEALPSEQKYAPRIRLEGGTKYPMYVHGKTTAEEFTQELEEYTKNLAYLDSEFESGNPEGKVFNIAELVSENVTITTSAAGALLGIKELEGTGKDVTRTMDQWEQMYDGFQRYLGLSKDATEEKHSYFPHKFTARVFTYGPRAWAAVGYTGYIGGESLERNTNFYKNIVKPMEICDNWAYFHEFGHIFNTNGIINGEITNNLFCQQMRRELGLSGDRAAWDSILNRFKGGEVPLGYFERLAMLSQLDIAYGYDIYPRISKLVRNRPELLDSKVTGADSQLRNLVVAYSVETETDLSDFFEGWGYSVATEKTKEFLSQYKKPELKIEYLHGGAYDYKGTGFNENLQLGFTTNINEENNTNTLTFTIDKENANDLLGYEILRDGEVVGFTKDSSFIDKNVDTSVNHEYKVVAYAKDLSTSEGTVKNLFEPSILNDEKITIELNSEFDASRYAKAYDYKGNELQVEFDDSNVDVTKRGNYEVTYTITDNNSTVTKKSNVEVVSGYDYLSDMTWESATTQYGQIRKNSNLKLLVNGKVETIEKGIGAHANAEIVYDLTDKSYDKFEALVGVDRTIQENKNSSIKFSFVADGVEVYNSGVMKYADGAKRVSIDVSKVKELKIIVDNAGNGNTSDHAVIGETKLTTNNRKPTLNIPSDLTTKVGEAIDLDGEFRALDVEDGDLTNKVEVTGKVNFNKSGSYGINYTVADSDGNEVTKTRTIKVVNMEDYTYLSDTNWKSATTSWGQVRKDLSASSKTLRLTGENSQEVAYTKGIGTHATSTIVYDLTNTNYGYFTSYIGVDRGMYGSVGSVVFQVYLDGTKVYDSGLMTSKQSQKFVEVNLQGAKEMKLVVTDGGNGNGSDHATFGDAKFHYAKEVEVDYSKLETLINNASEIDKSIYTEETVIALERALEKGKVAMLDKISTEAEVESIVSEIEGAINSLEKDNLDQAVSIADSYLKNVIKTTLNITTDNITLGDMRKLTYLSADTSRITSLSGLEYAKNLETLIINHSEIKDLSPLKNLTKLKNVSMVEGYIAEGTVSEKDGKVTLDGNVIDINGEKLLPTEIAIGHKTGNAVISLDENINGDLVQIDLSNFKEGYNTIVLKYNSSNTNFNTNLIYMIKK